MTWKTHCIANAAVAWALTNRLEVAAAAMVTATLPDQVEALLPFGRHRGASHWLAVWLGLIVVMPFWVQRRWDAHPAQMFEPLRRAWHPGGVFVGAVIFGLALGPFLHVLLDGCSDSGVPFAPFSGLKLKLGLYRTYNFRWRWDLSELLFLGMLLTGCVALWRFQR